YGGGDAAISTEEKSPYATTQMVSLEIGPKAVRFLVHESVLSRSPVLLAKSYPISFVKQSVALPELDQTTAHTLVHYLYTGRYQTLSVHAASDKVIPESYKQSACVYCAAVRYELPGLKELAQGRLGSFGEEVNVFDMLAVARDYAFPLLPEHDEWYPAYIEDALQTAMREDATPFQKTDFITTVEGNSRLLRLAWKTVMSNCARVLATPAPKENGVATPTAEAVPEAAPVNGHDDSVLAAGIPEVYEDKEEEGVQEDLVAEQTPDIAAVSETPRIDSPKTDPIEPTPEVPPTPKSFTDELDFISSKTYQQMGQKADSVAVASKEPKKTALVRSDSAMQMEQQAAAAASPKADAADTSSVVVEIDPVSLTKKSKKGKKSKKLDK
ncbi:uncharacterized protein SETTUDRAFT_76372, partial [Exserohilum turcica Et28A]